MDIIAHDDGGLAFHEVPVALYEQLLKLPEICEPEKEGKPGTFGWPTLSPTDASVSADERELIEEDWNEFVRPEFESANIGSIECVLRDLNAARFDVDDLNEDVVTFRVPGAHIMQWYHALNLARLMMAEKYQLPISEYGLETEDSLSLERFAAMHLSDFFAGILETFVYRMEEGLESPTTPSDGDDKDEDFFDDDEDDDWDFGLDDIDDDDEDD